MTKPIKKIAVVGAGIAGLATAHRLCHSTSVTVYEASDRLGGALQTTDHDGYRVEHSADMFVTQPDEAVRLCRELGIEDQLIVPNSANRFSSIVQDNRLIRIPVGFSLMVPNQIAPVLKSPLLSSLGKFRFLMERFCQPKNSNADESLKSFAVRHYGTEFFERIIQPLVAGIYSAKAEDLSMHATLRRFVDMEEQYGSLIKAAANTNRKKEVEQQSSGARYGMFVTPKNGFSSLIDTIAQNLKDVEVRLNSLVDSVATDETGTWQIKCGSSQQTYDGVVLATSANVAANQISQLDPELSDLLKSIQFGSMIVVTIQCDSSSFPVEFPTGFGFVVPEIENRKLIACSFSSNKFAGRSPEGKFLLRAFLGGRKIRESITMNDQQIQQTVCEELKQLIGYQHNDAAIYRVFRWENCMPQYRVGHLELIDRVDQKVQGHPGLALAGSSYKGVGIPACIHSGQQAADRMIDCLVNESTTT